MLANLDRAEFASTFIGIEKSALALQNFEGQVAAHVLTAGERKPQSEQVINQFDLLRATDINRV